MSKHSCLNPPAGRFIGWIKAALAQYYRVVYIQQNPHFMEISVSYVLNSKISFVSCLPQ